VNRFARFTILASLITACGAAGGIAQTYIAQPTDQAAAPQPLPILSPEQFDQLVGPIALYPDPLVAQILPASTYPIDIVKAARLIRSGASPDQIDQQPWDSSVKAVAHESSVIEMMDQSIDWTQQLGQAFIAQPDDVMQSIQRMRGQAQNVGNLTSTPQQQVYVEDSNIRIVPADPNIIYVPAYDPTVVYYTPPAYGSYVSFGYGFPCGTWFDLDLDWYNHWCYRPGWTWNHWHDNFYIEQNHIRPRHDFEPHHVVAGSPRPATFWHRDDSRPLTFANRRLSRPSDFDRYRGREDNNQHARTPETVHTPVNIDRGRAPVTRTTPPMFEQPRQAEQRHREDAHRAPAANPNAYLAPQPRAAEPARPATPPVGNPNAYLAPKPPAAAPARPATPPVGNPNAYLAPKPPAAAPAQHVAAPPAHVATPPVHIAPPPAARPSTPAYVQPPHQENHGGGGGGSNRGGDGKDGHK
jgi:hypothetical protein